jgi:hypothetical protein
MKLNDLIIQRNEPKHLFIAFDLKQKQIKEYLPDALFVKWDAISIRNGKLFIGKEPIESFTFIFVGLCGDNERKFALVREYITKSKVKSLTYGSSMTTSNKPIQSFRFESAGLNQPKTIIGKASELTYREIVKELGLPVISKILDGSQGKGIEKHDTNTSLIKFLESNKSKDFIFQEFIPNDGDIRAFFFRGDMIFSIKRTAKAKGEFRNNVSLGGSQEFVELPDEAKRFALAVNNTFSMDFAGVDIIQHKKDKRWYALEINSAPQFINKDELVIPKIVQYIRSS